MGRKAGARLRLSENCNGEHAPTLVSDILTHQGNDLVIDASKVKTIDTPCIEVLIAAARLWSSEDMALRYQKPSKAFLQGLEILGIEQDDLATMRSDHGR